MQIAELRFLVVEDHDFQRETLVNLLRRLDAKCVHAAANGAEALKILNVEVQFDVVITDVDMPVMDGLEFIRHMGEAGYKVSVILASALERTLLGAVEAMAKAYGITLLGAIEKPISQPMLERIVNLHLPPAEYRSKRSAPAVTYTIDEILGGLRGNEFEAFFQPKIEVATRRLVGAEALARWRHPQHGIVPPGAFIATLEQHGEIDGLMWVMLNKSAAFAAQLRAGGNESVISVNLSLKSLVDVDLATRIADIAQAFGIPPRQLCLEITESAATTDLAKALENLTRLRMKGFGLSIDDYGTGYSSMQQLTRIPFTELKIDRSFVTNAGLHAPTKVILGASLEMARKLGIAAVAEGVETQQDWDLLAELGCDLAQGYFIAKPMPVPMYVAWAENLDENAMTIAIRA